MEKVAKLGRLVGLGLVALIGVLLLVGDGRSWPQRGLPGQPAREAAGGSRFAQVGETVKLQGWEVTLLDFGPYERFSPGPPASQARGVLVVGELRITNIQNRPADLTLSDFALEAGDGRRFEPAAETATVERGLVAVETVQPQETIERRVVFDVPPDARDLVLEALEIEFSVPAPGP